jgi:hypothetical protein
MQQKAKHSAWFFTVLSKAAAATGVNWLKKSSERLNFSLI